MAGVVELADTQDLGSCAFGCEGSSPSFGTELSLLARSRLSAPSSSLFAAAPSVLASLAAPLLIVPPIGAARSGDAHRVCPARAIALLSRRRRRSSQRRQACWLRSRRRPLRRLRPEPARSGRTVRLALAPYRYTPPGLSRSGR